jgi:hypothetical protein
VFTPLAAGGGGVGGYFLEKATKGTTNADGSVTGRTAEPALYMLAGGMALLIPALVLTLNATAYKPPEGDRADPSSSEPSKAPPKAAPGPVGELHKAKQRREYAAIPHVPLSFFDVYKGKVALGLPALEVRPLYSQEEIAQYRVTQGTEVRIPVFKAMF